MVLFDAIIIGSGTAGHYLAQRFSLEGKSCAIIEQGRFGGSCLNYGCTPTKALVANAKIAHSVRQSKTFGINVDAFQIDYKAIKLRKDMLTTSWSYSVEKSLKSLPYCTVFEGLGFFEGPHQVRVGEHLLEGKQIFIDVGTQAHIPAIEGLNLVPFLTNVSLLDIDVVPEHLVILGGGYVGLEFAQIYRRFGAHVSVIQQPPFVMPKEDPDVSVAIQEILSKEGINIYTNAINFKVLPQSREGKIHAQFEQNSNTTNISGSHLLVAVGRVPNTKTLDLNKAKVLADSKGFIEVDDALCTSQSHIWALGDCNGRGAFTHTSFNDYEIVSGNLFENANRKVTDRIPIYCLYTDPPFARVGINETQALERYDDAFVAKMPMTDVARAWEKGETDGFLKILASANSKQILGASFLGTGCDEVIHMIAVAMQAKLPYTAIQSTVMAHPTVSELIPTLLSSLKPLSVKNK